MGFHAVAQGEVGAWVAGFGGVEGLAELVDGGGVAWFGQRVESDVQGVGGGVGDDVAGACQGGADQDVGFVGGAGVNGAGDGCECEGLRGVERGDADGMLDQFGFGVQCLLAGIDLCEREPGGDCLMRGERRCIECGFGGVDVGLPAAAERVRAALTGC